MRKIILIFCMLIGLCGCQPPQLTKDRQIKMIVASDLHYFLKDYYKDCEWFEESMLYGDGKMVTYADEIIDAFIADIRKEKPQIVILTGDLSFNGELGSHEGLAKKFSVLKDDGITVAVLPGNHDIDNIYTKGYGRDDYFDIDNIDAQQFRKVYKDLGYQLAVSRHKESLSYRIDLNQDYALLMMDSTAHNLTGSPLDTGGYFTDSSMTWLETQLKDIQSQGKRPIVAMHHNLAIHNDLKSNGFTIKNNQKIADLFKQYHVPFVLSGHIHCQNIKQINGIYDIASSSLLDAPLQYGVIELDQKTMNYHTQSLKISRDANEYFDLVSSTHFAESFEVITDQKKRAAMKDVVVKANRYYFTGNMKEHIEEIKNMEGYSYYYDKQGESLNFYKSYLESMLKEQDENQKLTISLK